MDAATCSQERIPMGFGSYNGRHACNKEWVSLDIDAAVWFSTNRGIVDHERIITYDGTGRIELVENCFLLANAIFSSPRSLRSVVEFL
jgi:hypothetical protein